jgi:hypothetical protein
VAGVNAKNLSKLGSRKLSSPIDRQGVEDSPVPRDLPSRQAVQQKSSKTFNPNRPALKGAPPLSPTARRATTRK